MLSMRRRLFACSSLLSLLLLVLVCALWMRSYWARELIALQTDRFVLALHNGRGCAALTCATGTLNLRVNGGSGKTVYYERAIVPFSPVKAPLGMTYNSFPVSNSKWAGTMRIAGAAHWFLATLTTVPPLVWLVRRLRRGSHQLVGHCTKCGYDLRATPDRCPECGAVPAR
jgi:hypothetical protein